MASVTEIEQATNRDRLLLIAPRCGFSPEDMSQLYALVAKYMDVAPEFDEVQPMAAEVADCGTLRYGDGCISAEFPRWTGRVVDPGK